MKGALLCQKGLEDLAAKEVSRLIKAKAEVGVGSVVFPIKKVEDLFVLCYRSQLATKVLLVLDQFPVKGLKDIVQRAKKLSIPQGIDHADSFAVRGDTDISESQEVAAEIGAVLFNKLTVNLEKPDLLVCVYVSEGNCLIGIDFAGDDLSKRDYRIYQTRQGLKAATCKAVVDMVGFKEGQVLVNPSCAEGLFGIEALSKINGKSIHFYHKEKFQFRKMFDRDWDAFFDKLDKKAKAIKAKIYLFDEIFKHVDYAKKNAKIAGVHKLLNFSRLAIEWLDTKFDKESVDCIVCHPLQETKFVPSTKTKPLHKELFYQAKFVLKPKGKMALLMKEEGKLDAYAEQQGLKKLETRKVWQGKNYFFIELFGL